MMDQHKYFEVGKSSHVMDHISENTLGSPMAWNIMEKLIVKPHNRNEHLD